MHRPPEYLLLCDGGSANGEAPQILSLNIEYLVLTVTHKKAELWALEILEENYKRRYLKTKQGFQCDSLVTCSLDSLLRNVRNQVKHQSVDRVGVHI